jgi:D-lactate dehydrogenase
MSISIPDYSAVQRELAAFLPPARLITDPLRRLTRGTDASFYRLIPRIVAVMDSEDEVRRLLAACAAHQAPVTFRAAGTSLSGQAISDSVLAVLGDGWRGAQVLDDGARIRVQAGVIGSHANRLLAPYGRKLGPDPASIDVAQVGGIAANNASGMCCGVADNSYHTLAGMRLMLADGTLLDTDDAASAAAFRRSHAELLLGLAALSRRTRRNTDLAGRIRRKYRIKNTTGYGLNALLDFDDPLPMLTHLLIGSEGTLAFISSVTYRTVPEHPQQATALVLFDGLRAACEAVQRIQPLPVAAAELMDRAALASVEHKPGMPGGIRALGPDGAALLVETRAADGAALAAQVEQLTQALAAAPGSLPFAFTTDAAECAKLWKVRKGTFPSVGARRAVGTTVIIEDVAFPLARLADATLDLQALLRAHGCTEAILFGHALAGNLHFCFTQDFNTATEVARYGRLMDAVARLVVEDHDGSLKAEHGTGRNMAPFVELEWGLDGVLLMHEIKALIDPQRLLNPGVILNDDPRAHLEHLKALPAADPLVDKCIECGFCEPVCPSAQLTLTPRQRITGWREIARREAAGEDAAELKNLYDYAGIDTCAACGLCATACPVEIETGLLIKKLRGQKLGERGRKIGRWVGEHFDTTTAAVRLGLGAADLAHASIGPRALGAFTGALRRASGERLPAWTPALPRPARFSIAARHSADEVVYFPSCAARTMGPMRGDPCREALPTVTARLLGKAGYGIVYPDAMDRLCCGQPFESKGLAAEADAKSAELEAALRAASNDGRRPIVFDTSTCAYRMKRYLHGRLRVHDVIEALHDLVLPRVHLTRSEETIALHTVCTVRKSGLTEKLAAVAQAVAAQVVQPAEVGCCAFAGDRGFNFPELNAHALRDLRAAVVGCTAGYSTNRTCEIGLVQHSGLPYRSLVYLVERQARLRGG